MLGMAVERAETPVENLRTYGTAPFRVAVIHGGPGAQGAMAPVAQELSATHGTLEPLQTADSLEGQVAELASLLERAADGPTTLIGGSWGAWLSSILAARRPDLVSKLILVGSGPFEARYAQNITAQRLARLSASDQHSVQRLMIQLEEPAATNDATAFAQLGTLMSKADAYDPIPHIPLPPVGPHSPAQIFRNVWRDANELRQSGLLLALAQQIRCPVLAIHGDYDPHPAEGVRLPLSRVLRSFRFVLLIHCGHEPWNERQARDTFYQTVRHELSSP
jgi:pimeloyl-ACP methyl ester carboxylesterase